MSSVVLIIVIANTSPFRQISSKNAAVLEIVSIL